MKNLQNKEQVLISKFQQRCLWEGIIVDWISKEKIDGELIGISDSWQLANKALEAWYILNIWNIPLASLKKYFWSKESQSFLEWANRYKLICQQLNYVDQIHKNPFMDFKSSIAVTAHQGEQLHCFKIPCWDFVQEVNMAANWAKKLTGNIGIVILDLEQVHSQVDYIFSNFLKETEYNISRSPKLNDSPLINIVLLILQIANSYITNDYIKYEDFSKLLRTKFIVGADLELCSRSYMDYLLRKELDYEFNWQYLINKLQINNLHATCNVFIKLCNDFEQELINSFKDQKFKHTCRFWVDFCNRLLQKFLCCEEHIINDWEILFNQYLHLTKFLGEHDLSTFIKTLKNLANQDLEHLAIIRNNLDKNINVLGLLDAIQLEFDNLWICGLSDVNWLEVHQSNPFLPISLQKEFNVPLLDSKEAVNIYSNLLQSLINKTSNLVICSYPLYIEGNRVGCSKLIDSFPDGSHLVAEPINQVFNNKIKLETYEDHWVPTYKKVEFSGTKFLKLQVACPFQANAKIRLKADPLKIPSSYLEPVTKGEILHKTMESFWFKYKSSSIVKQLSITEIYKDLLDIVNKILNTLKQLKPVILNSTIIKIEANRIANLCCNFINNYDLNRADFIILHLEKKFTVSLKEFFIKIKIDRIDQLVNSNLSIIDYKTGKFTISKINDWQDPRIDDPQLLIYSLSLPNIEELNLAVITVDPKFVNLSNWQEQKNLWYENLYKLAKDFQSGVAVVDPKYGDATCRQCDLKYMCRIFSKGTKNI